MTLLLRAIVRERDVERVADDALVAARGGGLAALATRVDGPVEPSEAALREHERLTRRIHDRVPSLPARYGQAFATAHALAEAVLSRADELHASLERVGTCVELAITLRWRDPVVLDGSADASSGREYLAQRASVERERRRSEEIVERFVADLSCEHAAARHKTCPRPGVAAIVAILIGRDEVEATRQRVASFGARSREVSAVIDGVFAPYSFAS